MPARTTVATTTTPATHTDPFRRRPAHPGEVEGSTTRHQAGRPVRAGNGQSGHHPRDLVRVAHRMVRYGAALASLAGTYAFSDDRGTIPLWREAVRQARKLGPAPVKILQIVSTRTDLLDVSVCEILASLTEDGSSDRARAPGSRCLSLPERYELERVAHHGSIASVRYARCPQGTPLAVKVLRGEDVADLRADLLFIRHVVSLLSRFRADAAAAILPILDAVEQQSDLVRESDLLTRISTAMHDRPGVIVPGVISGISTQDTLWMHRAPQPSRSPWTCADAELAMRVAFELIFVHGLAHCDLHAGNLYFTDSGELVILDAGFVIPLSETTQSQFAEFFIAITENDVETCLGVLRETSRPEAWVQVDVDRIREDLGALLDRSSRQRSAEFSLGQFGVDLLALQLRQGLVPAPEFAFPLTSLMTLEGRIRSSHPSLDFHAVATRVITEAVLQGKVRTYAERPYMQEQPRRERPPSRSSSTPE